MFSGLSMDVLTRIKNSGIQGNEGFWNFVGWKNKALHGNYFGEILIKGTREGYPEFPAVAFADELCTYYYALRHNYREGYIPLVIRAKIDLGEKYVYVDGRDFLYTLLV